eukprot:6195674-Pleurochrysis_carterae.AAC.3
MRKSRFLLTPSLRLCTERGCRIASPAPVKALAHQRAPEPSPQHRAQHFSLRRASEKRPGIAGRIEDQGYDLEREGAGARGV